MSSQRESLVGKSCTPCRGGIPPLNKNQVKAYRRHTPEWTSHDEDRRIERTFKFNNFAEAFAFIKRASDLAETEGHHPDITFGWGYATVSLQTKKIKGLHENDFIMAAKLEEQTRGSSQPKLVESAADLYPPTNN
jgi:4a-hydroxytetrahydrobiopterin dehydratase